MTLYFLLLQVPFSPFSKSLFHPSQSLGFVLFRVLVSPSSKSRSLSSLSVPFLPLRPLPSSQSPLPSSSESRFFRLKVLSPPPPPPSPVPILSESSSLLFRPLPSSSEPKKNSGTTRSRPAVLGSVWLVLKWNILPLLIRCSEQFRHGSH